MSEKLELLVSYPTLPSWPGLTKVEWINCSEAHLKKAGLMAVGFGNGAVFLAPLDKNIQPGDKVKITEVSFGRTGNPYTHSVFVVHRPD